MAMARTRAMTRARSRAMTMARASYGYGKD